VGLNLPRKIYYEKELTFLNSRSYGPGRYDPAYEEGGQDYPLGYVRWTEGRNLGAFVDLVSEGKVDVKSLVSHRFPVASAPQAYELITNKDGQPFLGVLLTYPPAEEGLPDKTDEKRVTFPSNKGQKIAGNQLVRLGVLGAGNFAQAVMLPAIQRTPNIELVGITSASGVSASHAAKRYGFRYASSDEVKLINDPDVNTVAILTRHNLHAGQVINSLVAGKNVFCEKPLALNRSQLEGITATLDRLSQASDDKPPPVLTVGYNRRFAPLSARLKSALDSSQEPLVMMYRINAGYLPPTHWTQDPEIGGGRIIGEACHFVDYLAFLVGEPPISVQAAAMQTQGLYSPDTVVMTFSFPDGSIGTVSYLSNGDKAFPKERVEVFTSGMVAVLDDFRSLELVQNGRRTHFRSRLRQDKGHQAEWQVFVNSILQGGPPPIAYQDLFGVMRAVFASLEALQSGKAMPIPRQAQT
jgi:predicted dehydrogenase